jgi:hypothetical protein
VTCNALKMAFHGNHLPRWQFLARPHNLFAKDLARKGIPAKEIPWALCIVTNSGNSISGRGRIRSYPQAKRIECSYGLENRYGIRALAEYAPAGHGQAPGEASNG